MSLRPYQKKAINNIENSWSSGKRAVCLQAPTGSGKSVIIRDIIRNHSADKRTIWVVAHRKNLVKQLSGHLQEVDVLHSLVMSGSPMLNYRVKVCSMQTLVSRLNKFGPPGMLVIDEAHHIRSASYHKIIDSCSDSLILGVTATPRRTDGRSLGDVFEDLHCCPSMKFMINNGYLSDFDYLAPDTVSMEGVHTRMGEYVNSEVLEKVDKKVVIGSAVDHYREYSDHLPAIAACVSIDHAKHVAEEFNNSGYKFKAIHSKMDEREIEWCIKGLGDGSLDGLANVGLIGEGTDIPIVNTLIGLRPTKSETIFLQYAGRVLRKHEGKEKAIILDHVNNWDTHGLPDDDRSWTLENITKEKNVATRKRCPECIKPIPISSRHCPHCGYQFTETAETVSRIPEEKAGVLVNIRDIKEKSNLTRQLVRATSLKHAIRIAKGLGYKHTEAFDIWTKTFKNKPDQLLRL